MDESRALIESLKRCLKAKGVTYRDLAAALSLSEASVKRLFAEETLSLRRITSILRVLDMTMLDLAKLSSTSEPALASTLTLAQEEALAGDPALFRLFHALLFRQPTPKPDPRRLRELEELGLIERHPAGRVKLRTTRNVEWRKDGPLRRRYADAIRREFLAGPFDGEAAVLGYTSRSLTAGSRAVLKRKLAQVAAEMDALAEVDATLKGARLEPTSLLVAFRPFTFTGEPGTRGARRP